MKNSCKLKLIVSEAINEGLSALCGSAGNSVIFFLANDGAIKPRSNIENLESFSDGLEKIFGFGSKIIEKRILEILWLKLQLPPPNDIPDEFEFSKEVERIFNIYEINSPANAREKAERESSFSKLSNSPDHMPKRQMKVIG